MSMANTVGVELYQRLYLARKCEDTIIKLYPEDEMRSPMHMSYGQESIPAGVCQALKSEDPIYTTYRSHAAYLAKTMECRKFFAELYGKTTGTARGKSGSMHLALPSKGHYGATAIVASNLPLAVGTAYAIKYRKQPLVACAFFGDGAMDEGSFWESINIAALQQVPVMFICEDNGYAVHTPTSARQGFKDVMNILKGFEIDVYQLDNDDPLRIYQIASEASSLCRKTFRPAFLKISCYRYLEHVGINEDFGEKYRDKSKFDDWQSRDSVAIQRERILKDGLSVQEVESLERKIEVEIEEAVAAAKEAPEPSNNELLKGVLT
jgi:acetoin:2,6-dichlorophenolindophenol oxidoreductase subunit alpha